MKSLVIEQSNAKMVAALLGSIAFAAGGFLLFNTTDVRFYLVTGCFSIFSIIGFGNLLRPTSITLDDSGFTVKGGIFAKSRGELWENVSEFYLENMYSALGIRIGKRIAYNYTKSSMHESFGAKTASMTGGSDAGVGGAWKCSQAELLQLLNEYRSNALTSPCIDA